MQQKIRPGGKINLNFAVHPQLAEQFREASKAYHGRLSTCFAAAMAMWLAADPEEQGRWLMRIYQAEVDNEVGQLLEKLQREQELKVKQRTRERSKRK